jgi:acyl-CoA thioesterase-2
MDASFHDREPGLAHQMDMIDVPGPETLVDDRSIGASSEDPDQQWAMRERPFEVRSVYQRGTPDTEVSSFPSWIRFLEPVADDQHLHRYLLAYASDMNLVATARQPHRNTVGRNDVRMASLDHAIWFHHDINVNDWLVYIKESPQGGAGRGFNRGAFYTREGIHVASTIQEGLMRVMRKTDKPA